MTVESCVNFCAAAGSSYAGLEYGRECYCAASIPSTAQTTEAGKCNKLCSGNNREFCGGVSAVDVYRNTPGSVGGDGVARTANAGNGAVIQPNTTTTTTAAAKKTKKTKKMKRDNVLGEGRMARMKLRWERAVRRR